MATTKRLLISERRGDSNHTLSPRVVPDHTYLTQLAHSNLSQGNDWVGQSHYSREKGVANYILSTPADRSMGPHPVSLPLSTKEVVKKAKHLSTAGYEAYRAHISDMRSVRSILADGSQPIGP
jgi:hypothetical protein